MSTEPNEPQPFEDSSTITERQFAEATRDLAIARRSLALLHRKQAAQAAELQELRRKYAGLDNLIDGMVAKLDRAKVLIMEIAGSADVGPSTGAVAACRGAGKDA